MRHPYLTALRDWLVAAAIFAVLAAPDLLAATYAPAATAAIDWTPNTTNGVGVPGGIPARTTIFRTIASTGDTTDRKAEIEDAMLNCPEGQTVLLGIGVFYVSHLGNFSSRSGGAEVNISNRTLRGSGSDPVTGTRIVITDYLGVSATGGQFQNGPGGNITGSPVKGDTTLSVTNAGELIVGRIMGLSTANDETLPVLSVDGAPGIKSQVVTITAVNTGAGTVTFRPGLYQTPVKRVGGAALAMTWGMSHGRDSVTAAGFEDFCVDNTSGTGAGNISFSGATGCWIKNVYCKGVFRYGITILESTQCEIRDSWVEASRDPGWVGSSHAGINIGGVSALLIENNVILPNFPLIESQNGVMSGCVFGYNFGLAGTNNVSFSNHGAGNHCNLWEGNSTTNITADGYFGSAADDVIFRNDCHGVVIGSDVAHWPVALYRFTRRFEIVGNQMGRAGTHITRHLGGTTAFNSSFNRYSNDWDNDPPLDSKLTGEITRNSDTNYTVALDQGTIGDLYVGQWPITLRPQTGTTEARYWLEVLAISGMNVTLGNNGINNSYGSVFTSGTAGKLWPGSNGFWEYDLAVEASCILLGNYYLHNGIGIPAEEALGSTTLPASLYRSSAPSFMSGYNWPPYDPQTPDLRYQAIPAGARYVASINTVASPSFSPAAGAYASSQSVTITCATSGATIYYTTNGTTPTTSSSVYSSALTIAVSPSTTLKAFAVKSGMTDSGVTSGTYSQTAGSATPGYSPTRTFFRRR